VGSPLPEDRECEPPIRVTRWSSIARRIRVPLGFGFAVLYCWLSHPTGKSIVAGALVAIPGLLIRALASGHVQKNEQLTTSGPYAYTRNPLYLGSLILAVGFAIAARSWVIVTAMLIIFVAVYIPVIQAEETFLRGNFPGFGEYASRVPRLFPRIVVASHQSKFSWDLYLKHREYNAILGAVVMFAALISKLLLFAN
jgi:protein-S-isoprenylcysteine O-methyltransferase Ste14